MLYFIKSEDRQKDIEKRIVVKIGVSKNPDSRVKELQTGNHTKLTLIKTINCVNCNNLESEIHKLYKTNNISGEWFEFSLDDFVLCKQSAKKLATKINNANFTKVEKTVTLCSQTENKETTQVNISKLTKVTKTKNSNDAMDVYYCGVCKYYTRTVCNFKRHLTSQKHADSDDNNTDLKHFQKKLFICECGEYYTSKQNLNKHSKKCSSNKEFIQLSNIVNELKQDIKNKDNQLNKALDIAKENSSTANTSMNILKYAQLHLTTAEPLEELKGNDIYEAIRYNNPKGKESKNETYVKTAIHKFTHGNFASFIGDMIIEYYKPRRKNEANLITTDTSRLCFIIMQKVNKNKLQTTEWINDKSGKKFTELVLTPIINAVKEILIEFIEFKQNKTNMDLNLMEFRQKCAELKRDISVGKFTKPILKHIAPNFHFDKLKFLDDDMDSSSDESIEKPPTKVIKIKIKKT